MTDELLRLTAKTFVLDAPELTTYTEDEQTALMLDRLRKYHAAVPVSLSGRLSNLEAETAAIKLRLDALEGLAESPVEGPVAPPPTNASPGRIWPIVFFPGASNPLDELFKTTVNDAMLDCSAWLRENYQCRLWFEWSVSKVSSLHEAEWTANLWSCAERSVYLEPGSLAVVAAYCGGAPGYGAPMLSGQAGLAAVNGAILERLAKLPVAERRFAADPALNGLTLDQDRQGAVGLFLHEILHAAGASFVDRDPTDGVYEPHPSDPTDLMSSAGPLSWPNVTLNAADLEAILASGFATAL